MSERKQSTATQLHTKMINRYGEHCEQHKHNKSHLNYRQHCRSHPVQIQSWLDMESSNMPTGDIGKEKLAKFRKRMMAKNACH